MMLSRTRAIPCAKPHASALMNDTRGSGVLLFVPPQYCDLFTVTTVCGQMAPASHTHIHARRPTPPRNHTNPSRGLGSTHTHTHTHTHTTEQGSGEWRAWTGRSERRATCQGLLDDDAGVGHPGERVLVTVVGHDGHLRLALLAALGQRNGRARVQERLGQREGRKDSKHCCACTLCQHLKLPPPGETRTSSRSQPLMFTRPHCPHRVQIFPNPLDFVKKK